MDTFDFLIGKYENKKHNALINFLIKEAVAKKEQELYGTFIEEVKQLQEKYEKIEKEKLNKIYEELKKKQLSSEDGEETYTTGYRNGHTNGQIELLERILVTETGLRSEKEVE